MRSPILALLACVVGLSSAPCFAQTKDAPKPPGETAPKPEAVKQPSPQSLDESIRRGLEFLYADQNKNGSWGTHELNKAGVMLYAPIPGAHHAFQAAVTAMCISAICETGGDGPHARKALDRAEAWLIENLPKLRRADPTTLYNIWGHIYGIQACVHLHQRSKDDAHRRKLVDLIHGQIEMMQRYESVDKGWGYYDFEVGAARPATSSTSFMTAAALVAFHDARTIGIAIPKPLVKGAVASIHRQLLPDFSYLYGEYLKYQPAMPINRPGGSLGRSQACNVALRLWKDEKVTDAVLKAWLDRLFARNGWLDMGRKKPFPHESHFQVAGYFYYFGHYYAAIGIEQLPAADRPFYQDHLATLMIDRQSKDGSWWDFPLYNYHQQYGTAFALMTLHRTKR